MPAFSLADFADTSVVWLTDHPFAFLIVSAGLLISAVIVIDRLLRRAEDALDDGPRVDQAIERKRRIAWESYEQAVQEQAKRAATRVVSIEERKRRDAEVIFNAVKRGGKGAA